jgi:hypothetical protein
VTLKERSMLKNRDMLLLIYTINITEKMRL